MAVVFIGIGSSINRAENIRLGLVALKAEFGELLLSPLYESEAVGFSGINFYNLVAKLHTEQNIMELIKKLKAIEKQFGRPEKSAKFTPRTLDLDLLLYDQQIEPDLDLPRAEILKNAFVLKPLSELAPTLKHPVLGESYQTLWSHYPQQKQKLWKI
ncbi:MAG: 2-amino-4-hydroxy-6-hydroxymethyldihydropteridine diphosphokinase [Psychromonas sp.]|jgi:2-amino-4-hydroxy-6-hydroxymethyldihydropteridine diphosphokinase|uniref:2-amino-4-hydroxy-6- hydroxymethyldihydropteridine diphosphokinase n=1 Tax=Psychromonas sp. TaxID=1884585 RepID=UPI0039E63A64